MGDVVLTGANGKRRLADREGQYLLVFFGFANCPDVCPLTLARLATTYEALEEPENVQVVMIAVDLARDTPGSVQAYAESFHPSFVGLGGTNSEIAEAAKRFLSATSNSLISRWVT